MGITHVISLNPHDNSTGRYYHDPTLQMRRLRLRDAKFHTQLGLEACSLTPDPERLTIPPPRVSPVTKATQVLGLYVSFGKYAGEAWSEKEQQTQISVMEHLPWGWSPLGIQPHCSIPARVGYICPEANSSGPP